MSGREGGGTRDGQHAEDTDAEPDGGTVSGSAGAAAGPASDRGAAPKGPDQPEPDLPVGYGPILDHVDTPIFVVDAEGRIAHWNRSLATLTGEDQQGARELAREHGVIGPAFYHDGRRSMTLAEKVLEAPESADREYDVPRVRDVDYTLYADRSVMKDARGRDRHIEFSAAPIYRDGELAGVVEMIHDRTEDALEQEQLRGLVGELQATMGAIREGDLSARVHPSATDHIDDELLTIVDALNDMADRLEDTVADVAAETDDLRESVAAVADSSQEITATTDEQAATIAEISDEVSDLSATVEEVASTSDEVADTAAEADDLADEVRETATETQQVMADVASSASQVAEDVDALRERIDQIDEVVEVINDIAEQTNMLALNASIEAARAGEEGQGFAVVADEVKNLAEESQRRAGEIEDLVDDVKADATDTLGNLQETNEQVNRGLSRVTDATDSLEGIVEAVGRTADGVEQVSAATDDQAASAAEIAGMLDEAVERADEVNEEVSSIAETNRRQADRVDRIVDVVDRLSDGS